MPVSKTQTFRNVIYNALMRGATMVCQLVATTIVARNLNAADLGVVGFANIIIVFLFHFADCGVGSAAIRKPKMDQHTLETAFTLKIVLGAGAFGTAMLVAPFVYLFCDHPAAANVTRFLALNFFVSTIGFLPQVVLTREMNFKALVVPGVINAVVRATLAITLIFCGWKFWAVAVADVGANLASGIATQFVRKIRLRLRWNREDVRELLAFGLPLLGTGLLAFMIFNLANFLVSAKLGIAQFGYYALAFNWGSFICGLLTDTVISVLFPTFSAIQHDNEKLRRWYLKTVDLVAFVAIVANTALLANAQSFLVIFLGKGTDKWMPAALAMQILCVYGVIRAITEPIGNCLMARGQTRTLLKASLLCGGLQILLLVLALPTKKIEWIAVSVTVAYASQALIYVPFLRRELGVTLPDLIRQLWPIIPAALVGWAFTYELFTTTEGNIVTLALRGIFTAVVVAAVHGALTGFRCFQEAVELVFQKFKNGLSKAKVPDSI